MLLCKEIKGNFLVVIKHPSRCSSLYVCISAREASRFLSISCSVDLCWCLRWWKCLYACQILEHLFRKRKHTKYSHRPTLRLYSFVQIVPTHLLVHVMQSPTLDKTREVSAYICCYEFSLLVYWLLFWLVFIQKDAGFPQHDYCKLILKLPSWWNWLISMSFFSQQLALLN